MTERQERWMSELLGAKLADEPAATCGSCPMLDPPPGGVRFDAQTKCCTWMPQLPNFLAGGSLDVPTVIARIEAGLAVTPLGLGVPRAYANLQKQKEETFGRLGLLACPHLSDDGRCTIWRHRQSTCATWFCKYERGKLGADLWDKVHVLLSFLEWGVARWAARELGFSDETLDIGSPHGAGEELDRDAQPELYAGVWGEWAGREVDFYRETSCVAADVSLEEALAHSPGRTRIIADDVQQAFARVTNRDLPVLVFRTGAYRLVHEDTDRAVFEAYSPYDPIVLHPSLVTKLEAIEGRAWADDPDLSPALVRRLLDVGMLEAPK